MGGANKLANYGKRYMKTFSHKFGEFLWQQLVFGASIAGLILWQQIRRGLITAPTIKANVMAVGEPYGLVVGAIIVWHMVRTAYLLYLEDQAEIESLNEKLAAKVVITGLHDTDPRVEAVFVDERVLGDKSSSLRLTNRGAETAYMVRIFPVKLKQRILTFPDLAEVLENSHSARFAPYVGDQWGYDSHWDFVRAMSEEWASYPDYSTRREVVVAARIDFENSQGVRFEANFELLYHGGQGYNNPEKHKSIECRNFAYRRIPLGITLSE